MSKMRLRRTERGALLGIVMIMLMVLMAASIFAFFTLRTDSGATAQDRLQRQLFDCAEQGLAIGKTTFSTPTAQSQWTAYYAADATTGANALPAPPAGPFPVNTASTPIAGYPIRWCASGCTNLAVQVTLGGTGSTTVLSLSRVVAIYNNPGDTSAFT